MSLSDITPIEFSDERPIYRQIADQLRNLIDQGIPASGEPFPTEAQMVVVYGTARGTVRQARSVLEQYGLIERRRGKGFLVVDRLGGQPPS
jgi:DNA-binding GntR family transcriptional regulator